MPIDLLRRFWREERGSDATEYALLAALIAVSIIGGATSYGASLAAAFTGLGATIAGLPSP